MCWKVWASENGLGTMSYSDFEKAEDGGEQKWDDKAEGYG